MLDVRVPIGWLFLIYGVLLFGWGFYKPVMTNICAGQDIDLNLVWGALMAIFGGFMKFLVWQEKRKSTDAGK